MNYLLIAYWIQVIATIFLLFCIYKIGYYDGKIEAYKDVKQQIKKIKEVLK